MCGITGFVGKGYNESRLRSMTKCLQHRGPDAEGFFYDPVAGIGLGHRRLSILDLSAAANQPFYSRDQRYVMVYNGEVYNFREVALKYGITPRTSSDSEIIIESFALAGLSAINDLNGMFAIVIWDRQEQKLYLVRDRAGIKPLYYYEQDGQFAFASELKALRTLGIAEEIDHTSVSSFLYLGYIPGDACIYRSCRKLKPGEYAIYHNGQLEKGTYWKLSDKIEPRVTEDEGAAKKELGRLIESSVSYCMISDVPVGIFLSGGVDSSIVAATAQRLSAQPVKTFSIGFKEEKYNESAYAKQVAAHIGSDHHEFVVTENEALELVDSLLDIYDEPYADSSAIPTLMVSKLARQHVTVALSGDGGDELFMGYGFYYWSRRLSNPFIRRFRKPIARALHAVGDNRLKRGSKMFDYLSEHRIKSHIFSQEQYYFTEAEINDLLVNPSPIRLDEKLDHPRRKLSPMEEQSFFDILNYLPEELLVKTDRASMHHSLEVRVPLLDHRIVEFAINIDEDLKLKGKVGKYLLKQVLYDYVPPHFFDRSKWGFSIPLANWLKGDLGYLITKYLTKQVVEECGLVYPKAVEKLKAGFAAGKHYYYNRLWALIILHKWFKEKRS